MRKKFVGKIFSFAVLMSVILTGCGETPKTPAAPEKETEAPAETVTKEEPKYTAFLDQGNPHSIVLGDIAEDDKAWIKISTAFDPELSMYSSDVIPQKVTAFVVDFEVTGLENASTLYWCYMLDSGENTFSVWDDSSNSDKLEITEDGKYRFVFDAKKALGGNADVVSSLQIVFPNISDATKTQFSVTGAGYVLDDDISSFVTGKTE